MRSLQTEMIPPAGSGRREAVGRDMLVLAGFALALWLPTCGLWDLWTPDEGRYAQVAREVLRNDHWFALTLFGQPYNQKPPLPFLLFAAMIKASGGAINTWLLRLPSIFMGVVALLCTYRIGQKLFGRDCGFAAGLMLLTAPTFLENASAVELNVMYTGWCMVAMAAWLTRPPDKKLSWGRWLVFWLGIICAFFTKGPLVFLVWGAVAIYEARAARSWKVFLQVRPIPGLLILGGLLWRWMYAEKVAFGTDYARDTVHGGNPMAKILAGQHAGWPWYYVEHMLLEMYFPWILLFVPALVVLWRGRKQLSTDTLRIVWWFLGPGIFLSIMIGKRQSYFLPLMPAVAILTAQFASTSSFLLDKRERILRGLMVVAAIAAIGLLGGAAIGGMAPDWAKRAELQVGVQALSVLAAAGAGLLGLVLWMNLKKQGELNPIYVTAVMVLALSVAYLGAVRPMRNHLHSSREFGEWLGNVLRTEFGTTEFGAVSSAARPEYFVYGDVKMRDMRRQDVLSGETTIPAVLVTRPGGKVSERSDDWAMVTEALKARGYELLRDSDVSEDELAVFGDVTRRRRHVAH
ncbi:MAG: glycosyltransferase family 39 protein [Candidatus Sumerlaeaceae bacterium]|nr:glycosyltransferase family 39 protein [Candidatus Sumerlaeaceae bacterium]